MLQSRLNQTLIKLKIFILPQIFHLLNLQCLLLFLYHIILICFLQCSALAQSVIHVSNAP